MYDQDIQLGDNNGPSPEEYAAMMADLEMVCRCPEMSDAEIDAMAAQHGF